MEPSRDTTPPGVPGALEALAAQQLELVSLLWAAGDEDWDLPSECEGWSVADVILHLRQTDEMATASVRGHFAETLTELTAGLPPAADVDEGAGLMVAAARGEDGPTLRARYEATAAGLLEALSASDPRQRVQWVAGQLSIGTLTVTRLAETWIHTGDITAPLGASRRVTPGLWHVARLAWRTLPYAFARSDREMTGPVSFELTAPDGRQWVFAGSEPAATVVRGDALELCEVAARRRDASDTPLTGEGPDLEATLELVRTFA